MSGFHDNVLLGASGSQGYQISRSVRLRSSASAYFNWTPASAGNLKTWTVSLWVKRGLLSNAAYSLFGTGANNTNDTICYFGPGATGDQLDIVVRASSTVQGRLTTTQQFRDPSAWYHIVFAYNSPDATASERMKLYVNGVRVTAFSSETQPAQNTDSLWNTARALYFGRIRDDSPNYLDGYLTEINFIDGQALTPSSFGETNPITGVWQPKKYAGTYGTNGFYLNFSDNSAATAAAIGKDYSGNGNNWTPNNISVTAGVTYDSMLDVPTQWADGGNGRGNYATLNPLQKVSGYAPDNGNLRSVMNATGAIFATIGVTTGKWYWENIYEVAPNGNMEYGVSLGTVSTSSQPGNVSGSWAYSPFNGSIYSQSGTAIATVATASLNDVIGCALDVDAGTLAIYKNNSLLYTITSISGGALFPVIGGSSSINAQTSINFGQRPFAYTPPSGFKALNTLNLPTPTILKGNQYFDATTYTGTGATQSIVNSGAMQPDLVWLKRRNGVGDNGLYDSVRGVALRLVSNSTGAEASVPIDSFNANGFSTTSNYNNSGETLIAWQWKEGATQGFDIVTYTGDGVDGRTVAHNLGVAPKMVIVKSRSTGTDWNVKHASLSSNNVLQLNATNAQNTPGSGYIGDLNSSTTFTLKNGGAAITNVNGNGTTYVAYLFAEVAGFSKFGSYTGNGSADGPFVFCGFRPKFVMIKRTNAVANWYMYDTSRDTYNLTSKELYPNLSNAETTNTIGFDILSNGFKARSSDAAWNASGGTYIFMAFAENPFKNSLAR